MGIVYLIHFESKYHHAQHYIGWASNLKRRVAHHRAGTGANLLRVINDAGIAWAVVRTWDGNKALERRLKNRKKARGICPICRGKRL